ncbi:hypothetical protein Aperf_G00000012673 [Anoplocephala perfoliata]
MNSTPPRRKRKQDLKAVKRQYLNGSIAFTEAENESDKINLKMGRSADTSGAPQSTRQYAISRTSPNPSKHCEQERERRRELSLLYELIRQCITENDVRTYLPGRRRAKEKLSHLELLEIATLMRHRDIAKILTKILDDCKRTGKVDLEDASNNLNRATHFWLTNHPTNAYPPMTRKQSIVSTEADKCEQQSIRKDTMVRIDTHLGKASNRESLTNVDENLCDCQNFAFLGFEERSDKRNAESNSQNELDDELISMISKEIDFASCLGSLEVEPTLLHPSSPIDCSADLEQSKNCHLSIHEDETKECNSHLLNHDEICIGEIPTETVNLSEDYAVSTASPLLSDCQDCNFSNADEFCHLNSFSFF